MKNVTISMDDELASQTRIAAAKAGMSVSRYLADAAREKIDADEKRAAVQTRNEHLDALEKVWALPRWDVTEDGRMPTAEERNARR
ncbi:MAG: hypothetical protein M9924_12020 [Rhizobiaceae bacterium]|nr:hypothetical protein [Rhizobiaceae bacterium]